IHDFKFLAEDVGESALGKTTMQRHLTAFESAHHARTGTRTLTFVSTGRSLTHARTHTASDTLFLFRRLVRLTEVGEIHLKSFAWLNHASRRSLSPQFGRKNVASGLFSWRRRTVRRLGSRSHLHA